jgi:hypothetical protein
MRKTFEESIMSVDQSLMDQTYTQIQQKLLGAGANLQLVSPTIDWWWPTAPSGQIAARAFNLVNSIPKWSPVGEFSPSSAQLYNAYLQVLQQVNPTIPPDQQQAWTNAHNSLVAAQNTWQNDQTAMYRAWVVATGNLPPGVPAPDYLTWQKSSGWADTLLTDQLQIAKANQVMATVTGQQNPELNKALAAATLPADKNSLKPGFTTMDQGDGTLVPVPAYTIGTTGQDWVNLLSQGGGNKLSISVSQSKSSDNMSKSWASANASYNAVFWSVEINGSWEKLDIDQSDQSVEATIDMTVTNIQVSPGVWYDGAYMKTLAGNGQFFSPWTAKGGSSPIFGQNGLLQTMITGFVAAYQPSFTITMSASTYNQASQKFQAATGVRIGPFTFGGSGGHESNAVKKSASNGVFTGQSTATYPFIIGVTVATPGLD